MGNISSNFGCHLDFNQRTNSILQGEISRWGEASNAEMQMTIVVHMNFWGDSMPFLTYWVQYNCIISNFQDHQIHMFGHHFPKHLQELGAPKKLFTTRDFTKNMERSPKTSHFEDQRATNITFWSATLWLVKQGDILAPAHRQHPKNNSQHCYLDIRVGPSPILSLSFLVFGHSLKPFNINDFQPHG